MSVFRRARDTRTSTARRAVVAEEAQAVPVTVTEAPVSNTRELVPLVPEQADAGEHPKDYSDVFVCPRDDEADIDEAATSVTLFVYGWDNVEPGPLSWAFPSLRAALDAVRTMRNAIAWSIAAGRDHLTVEDARANGAVLIEQS